MEQANRTRMLSIRIEEVTVKLVDLRNNSRVSLEHSNDALRRNSNSRRIISEILVDKPFFMCVELSSSKLNVCAPFLSRSQALQIEN